MGRKDSLWSQALGPIESPVEHGISRTMSAHILRDHYKKDYEAIFATLPELPDFEFPDIARPADDYPAAQSAWDNIPPKKQVIINRIYANMGKAIGAYVRRIHHGRSSFGRYVEAALMGDTKMQRKYMGPHAEAGLALFIGKAGCINCHNGPLLTNNDFHNIGLRDSDTGRADAIDKVRSDEFNCMGKYSDAGTTDCAELKFMDTDASKYKGAFKTPSLRNVSERPPYMHDGGLVTLRQVLEHYNKVASRQDVSAELAHAQLTDKEMHQIEEFHKTLDGAVLAP